jgi:ABC-type sulfate/molybdate transport systems ATPase subunit
VLQADVEVDRREFTLRAAISVGPGERLALFGPSGAGKTTLLEAIAGLVQPRRGRVTLAGEVLTDTERPHIAIPSWRRQVGLLRQDPGLFPHLSVRGNLSYARGVDPSGPELTELAAALGLGGLLDAMPARLSGGQQHRAALGRLLLAHCHALLLDEPYSGLDAALRRALTALVVTLVADRGVPAVLVAHELADAQAFAHQMAVLDRGAVLQAGPPDEVVRRPASRRVAELVGYLGFVPAGGDLVAGIHPDRVIEGTVPGRGLVITGTLAGCRPSGAGWEADIQAGAETVTVRLPDRPVAAGGELSVTAVEPPLFGPDGAATAPDQRGNAAGEAAGSPAHGSPAHGGPAQGSPAHGGAIS